MKKFICVLFAALLSAMVLVPSVSADGNQKDNDIYDDWDRDVTLGDINGDGTVDGLDLVAMRRRVAGLETEGTFILRAADLNGDKTVDGLDLAGLRRIIAGLE